MNSYFILIGFCAVIAAAFYFFYGASNRTTTQERWLRQQLREPGLDDTEKNKLTNSLTTLLTQTRPTKQRLVMSVFLFFVTTLTALALHTNLRSVEYIANDTVTNNSNTSDAPDMETAIAQLKSRLQKTPEDVEGQMLYARSMIQLKNYNEAVRALLIAQKTAPENADVLTDLAQAIAFQSGTGNFLGEPEILLKRALSINPDQQKALWLQGINFFETGQYAQAEANWTRLLPMVSSDSVKQMLVRQIEEARRQSSSDSPLIGTDSPLYNITINVDNSIQNVLDTNEYTLFVFAKQPAGPPMPIAAMRLSPPLTFPLKVQMTDTHSLNTQNPLTSFDKIELSAKISLTGSATPSDDDIISQSVVSTPRSGEQISLKIDRDNDE